VEDATHLPGTMAYALAENIDDELAKLAEKGYENEMGLIKN
jgi:hypothetical protein